MDIFGFLKEVRALVFRTPTGSKQVIIKPNGVDTSSLTADKTYSLPDLDANSPALALDTLAGINALQTLQNKTLTSPAINGATIDGTSTLAGSSGTSVAAGAGLANAATDLNTANALVKRDASGNFAAGQITATKFIGNLQGNADTATTATNSGAFSGSLSGDVSGTQTTTQVDQVGPTGQKKTAAQISTSVSDTLAATSSNTASTIVKRDASGNFSAGTITANLTGNVTGNTSGSAGSFTGSLAGDVSGTQSSTSVDKIKGKAVSSTAPTDAQDLVWNAGTSQYVPVSYSGDATRLNTGAITVTNVGGVSAANVASGANLANAATDANTPNTLVKRDASGNIQAILLNSTVSGGSIANATNLNYAKTAVTPNASGEVSSTGFPLLRITSGTQLKGITGFTSGKQVVVINETGADITIFDQSATTSGAGIYLLGMTGGTATYTLANGAAMQLVYDGTSGYTLWYPSSGGGGGGGGSTTTVVNGGAAGYAVGTPVYFLGGAVYPAVGTAANTAEVVGVVVQEVSSGIYKVCLYGPVTGLPTSVFEAGSYPAAGTVLFLSTTSGKLSINEPSVLGQVSVPIGVYQPTGNLYFAPKRGSVVGGTNARTQLAWTTTGTVDFQSVANYEAGQITGWIAANGTPNKKFYISIQFAKNGLGTDYNVSYQTVGDTPPVGFSVGYTSGTSSLNLVIPAGVSSTTFNYALNAPAVGATFPLSVDASSITTGTLAAARLPAATGSSAGTIPFYEEGTWTAVIANASNLTGTGTASGLTYTRIGNTVFCRISSITGLTTTTAGNTTTLTIAPTGLPGLTNLTQYYGTARCDSGGNAIVAGFVDNSVSTTVLNLQWNAQSSAAALTVNSVSFTYTI